MEFNRAKGSWKTALESGAWLSLHFLTLLVFRTEQGAWLKRDQYNWSRVLIFLSQELQTRPDLSSARNILSLHHTSAWLKQLLGSNMIPLRTKFDTETTVISHRIKEREWERFSSPACLLLRSEFTEFCDRQHNTGVGDKNIVFLHLPRKFRAGNLGLLSINFDFRNVILQPMVVSSVWAKYKWKFMRDLFKLFFPRPLAASPLAFPVYRDKILFFVWTKCFVKFFSRWKIRSCEELRFSSHFSFSLFPFPVPYFTNIPTNQRPTSK